MTRDEEGVKAQAEENEVRDKGSRAGSECSALQSPPRRRPYTTCCLAESAERSIDLCARLRAITPCAREPRYSTRAGARSSTIAFCGEEEEEESVKDPCLIEAAATRKSGSARASRRCRACATDAARP